jgi:hypothetical protein
LEEETAKEVRAKEKREESTVGGEVNKSIGFDGESHSVED